MKKILTILMFVAVMGMFICSASAVDLHPHDFDGKVTLDVPSDDFARRPVGGTYFVDGANNLTIKYFTDYDLQAKRYENFDELIKGFLKFEEVGTDGDLTIYQDDDGNPVVSVQSDDVLVVVIDDDLEEAKAIASSADFLDNETDNETVDNDTNVSSSPTSGNAELKSQDFYGFFTMDVPKDSDFGDTENYDQRVVADTVYYYDEVNNITIQYINNDAYDDGVVKDTVDGLKQQGADVSTKDNLYLISANGINEVIFHEQPKTFTIISDQIDLDTLADMASSIEITDEN